MSSFELVFAVYGLLLGLAIAEVLGGFARSLKLKRGTRPVKIGWLTPLLGLLVILDLTSFWVLAWDYQQQISANYITLAGVLAIVGTYYLAAALIFPDEPEEWPDFDDWYDKQNRMVIGGLLAANIGSWIGLITLDIIAPQPGVVEGLGDQIEIFGGFAILALLIALLKVRNRRANVAMLSIVSALLLITGISESF